MTGRVLDGRYRVGAKIARGGMATVYEAHDLRLDRGCAVKVMHDDLSDDADFRRRFVREAHAAARLSHPNVVSVSDQGDDDGALFLVMEHVRGRTLREVMRHEAPMTPERALALLDPVLSALAEAHANGLVHRDVKPENVLIADDGRVKVADFGLARAFDASVSQTATRGVLIGTVSYLAPELIVDGSADPRVDVYAAGVLLYEMLTGRKPHEGEGAIQIAFKHVNEDIAAPSTGTTQPIPAYVDALVTRATSRDRDHRQADAKVFLHQLRRVGAALRAGAVEDAELTADLLPATSVPFHDDLDDLDQLPERTEGTSDVDTSLPVPDSEETTTVIRAAGLAGAGVGAPSRSRSATVTPERPRNRSAPVTSARSAPEAAGGPATLSSGAPSSRPVRRHGQGGVPGQPPSTGGAPPPPAGRRRSRRGLALLLVVVLLTVLAAWGGWWLALGRYTSMPGIINLTVSDAQGKVAAAGLDMDVSRRAFSESVPAGSVISTDPAAGSRIVEGGTVEVVVSKGRERYEVPALAGERFGDVEDILSAQNLSLGEPERAWSERVDRGLVISADPRAGTELRRDSVVTVTVSKGPKPIDVPDFTGKSAERAEEQLSGLGFAVSTSEEHSDTVDKGVVMDQSPDEGTAYKGDEIELLVSKGPVMVEVPDLQGMSVEEARSELSSVGLGIDVEEVSLYIGLDTVVTQDPKSGALPKGSTVTVGIV
jgi:eukaryotic-like serine/threonine-protein kinase